MANPNKAKGNSFERQLAEHLTKIFGATFRRVPNSGAMTGGYNAFRTAELTPAQQLLLVGDLIPPEVLGMFSWECKFYSDLPFHTLLTENALVDKWITQAKCPDREWHLCFKLNNKGAFVVFDASSPVGYNITGNYCLYKGCKVVKLEGFYEANKDIMLSWMKYRQLNPDKDDISKFPVSLEKVNKNADLIGKDLTLPTTTEFSPL